jgi:hypothetical protein
MSAERLVARLGQWWCRTRYGHDFHLEASRGGWRLVCWRCGRTSPGWTMAHWG